MNKDRDILFCSFCGKSQQEVKKLVAGPGCYICDGCINRSDALSGTVSHREISHCSFCGKIDHEVRNLVVGSNANICDECLDLCNDIIKDEA